VCMSEIGKNKAREICLERGVPLFTKEKGDCLRPTGKTLVSGINVWIGEEDLAWDNGEVVEVYPLAELCGYYVRTTHLFPESNLVRVGNKFKETTIH